MRFNSLNEMKMDLVSSTAAYVTSIVNFWRMNEIRQYQNVFETLSFYFEEYRAEYDIMSVGQYGDRDINAMTFISWCSHESFHLLKDTTKRYNRMNRNLIGT